MCEKLFEQLEDVADTIDRCANEIQTISARIDNENCNRRLFALQSKDPSLQLARRVRKLQRLVSLFTQASRGLKRSYVDSSPVKAWEEVLDDTWLYSRFLEEVFRPMKRRMERSPAVEEKAGIASRIA